MIPHQSTHYMPPGWFWMLALPAADLHATKLNPEENRTGSHSDGILACLDVGNVRLTMR